MGGDDFGGGLWILVAFDSVIFSSDGAECRMRVPIGRLLEPRQRGGR